ncbi:MAG: hypothetical protein IKE70_00140 [Bacilli bacterium]|nr:hypothetical protein [Bacilli bacterium]
MRGIFYEIMTEARMGRVIIGEEDWPIAFNTIIIDKKNPKEIIKEGNLSTLIIRNEEIFYSLLEKYIALELKYNRPTIKFYKEPLKNKIKWLMSYLWINATAEDFKNPEEYIERRMNFLEDHSMSYLENKIEIPLKENLPNTNLIVQKSICNTSMETPYKMDFTLQKQDSKDSYPLPSIYYGISNNTCYVYAMLTGKEKNQSIFSKLYQKKINRLLYKVNDHVEKEESLINYEKEAEDYPEDNIIDVTHSFVLSLTAFLKILEKNEIENVKVVPYLPLRYLSRDIVANRASDEKREELQKRNDTIQNNLTNKLIRTFRRVAHQNPNIEITSYPYEVDEYLSLKLKKEGKKIENPLLKETIEEIERNKVR